METMNHLILASKLNYINENDLKELRTKIEKVSAQISALRNYHFTFTTAGRKLIVTLKWVY